LNAKFRDPGILWDQFAEWLSRPSRDPFQSSSIAEAVFTACMAYRLKLESYHLWYIKVDRWNIYFSFSTGYCDCNVRLALKISPYINRGRWTLHLIHQSRQAHRWQNTEQPPVAVSNLKLWLRSGNCQTS